MSTLEAADGTPIHFEGDEATCLYRLLSGTVVTYSVQEDGRRQVTGFRFAGDFFGCDAAPLYSATAEAITVRHAIAPNAINSLCLIPNVRPMPLPRPARPASLSYDF